MGSRRARHTAPPKTRRWLTRNRVVKAMAVVVTLVVMAAIVTLTAVFTYHHTPARPSSIRPPTQTPTAPPSRAIMSPPPQAGPNDPATLDAEFTQLENTLHAKMGVAVSAVGNGQTATPWGDWQEGPAWSTIKVPLVIAAYRQRKSQQVTGVMKAAIT